MEVVGAVILIAGFVALARILGLFERSARVVEIAQAAALVVLDSNRSDQQKETSMRAYGKALLYLFVLNLGTGILALAVPLAAIRLMESAEILSVNAVVKLSLSWQFILPTVLLSGIYGWINSKGKPAQDRSNRHSRLERGLHHIVFGTWSLQVALSNLETRLFKRRLPSAPPNQPVFITALPRAGTTLVLELCAASGEFATHIYGDMPFLLTPLLWEKFSRRFRQADELRERVHGDGIMVNVGSPEAFEEIIWKGFWPSRYRETRIVPWSTPSFPAFERFMREHIHKLIYLRCRYRSPAGRYLSKNNSNIARIEYLKQLFPDAVIIVPFRAPMQHAASLLRQHRNFLKIHEEDSFAQKYMADTGHFDFGHNLRPIDFDGWLSEAQVASPETITFWLQYWIHSYRYLLTNVREKVTFLSYDDLCQDPRNGLEHLAEITGMREGDRLMRQVHRISAPRAHEIESSELPADLLAQAHQVYRALQSAQENTKRASREDDTNP